MKKISIYITEKLHINKSVKVIQDINKSEMTPDEFINYLHIKYKLTSDDINSLKEKVIERLINRDYNLRSVEYTFLKCQDWKNNKNLSYSVERLENNNTKDFRCPFGTIPKGKYSESIYLLSNKITDKYDLSTIYVYIVECANNIHLKILEIYEINIIL